MAGEKIVPPRSDTELAQLLERGRGQGEAKRGSVTILSKCAHEPKKLTITGRGAHSIIVVCKCGAGTLALLVPARPLTSAETDAIVALARESDWT